MTIVDEVAQWPETPNHQRLWGALVSLGKVPGARLLVMSSAGGRSHPAHKRWTTAEESPTGGPARTRALPWWTTPTWLPHEQFLPAEYRRFILASGLKPTTASPPGRRGRLHRELRGAGAPPGRQVRHGLDVGTRRDATVSPSAT